MYKLFNFFSTAAFISIAALSCNKPQTKDANAFENSVVVQGDRSQCKATGPIPNGNLLGQWTKIDWRETADLQFSSYLEFKNGTTGLELSFQNYCTVKSMQKSVLAAVSSKVYDNATSITVIQNQQKTVNDTIGGLKISCDVAAEAGTYMYKFDGLCLIIEGVYYVRKQ